MQAGGELPSFQRLLLGEALPDERQHGPGDGNIGISGKLANDLDGRIRHGRETLG